MPQSVFLAITLLAVDVPTEVTQKKSVASAKPDDIQFFDGPVDVPAAANPKH
jgi:hypothetical protein